MQHITKTCFFFNIYIYAMATQNAASVVSPPMDYVNNALFKHLGDRD